MTDQTLPEDFEDEQDNQDNQENTLDALAFQPTEEMFVHTDGSWRWKTGTIDPLTGRERIGAQFVRGAPSPNPRGRPRSESDHTKYLDRYVLPELERRIIEMLANPDIKDSDLIAAYRVLTDRRFGKPSQSISSTSEHTFPTYNPMVIGQNIIDRLNQQEQDSDHKE